MLFFNFMDAQPLTLPAVVAPTSLPALVQEEVSAYWHTVLAGLPVPQFPAPMPVSAPPPPEVLAGVKVEFLRDGTDAQGHWTQTFRATIQRGGTISDVAIAIFDDIGRSDEVFRAAQLKNPSLKNPAFVPVGQQIEITVDPTTVFVYKQTLTEQGGAVKKIIYYNGAVETYYNDPKSGVLRTVDFPSEAHGAQSFVFPDAFRGADEKVTAKPGTRLVDYRYIGGQSFSDVLNQIYNITSARAANELMAQSGWDANKWPPSPGAQIRIFISTVASYVDQKPTPLSYVPSDASAAELWNKLTAEREASGLFPVKMDKEGIVYQATVGASSVTAKQVAKLLFNDESKFLVVAQDAGLQVPTQDPAKAPPGYDPLLIGRTFEILVPFVQENFPIVDHQPGGQDGVLITRLANGTVLEDWNRPPGQSGLLHVYHYPNGYQNVLARPGSLTLLALDFIHFQFVNIANADLPREQREQLSREFQAQMLWTWSRTIPRTAADEAVDLRLHVEPDDTTFEVLMSQRQNVPWYETILYKLWFTYPLVLAVVVVAIGTVILFVVSARAQRAQVKRRRHRLGRDG